MRYWRIVLAITALGAAATVRVQTQTSPLFPSAWFKAIRAESTGELPVAHFRYIVSHFSGFAPSKGGDQVAD